MKTGRVKKGTSSTKRKKKKEERNREHQSKATAHGEYGTVAGSSIGIEYPHGSFPKKGGSLFTSSTNFYQTAKAEATL